jgi:hypothetical protein
MGKSGEFLIKMSKTINCQFRVKESKTSWSLGYRSRFLYILGHFLWKTEEICQKFEEIRQSLWSLNCVSWEIWNVPRNYFEKIELWSFSSNLSYFLIKNCRTLQCAASKKVWWPLQIRVKIDNSLNFQPNLGQIKLIWVAGWFGTLEKYF